MRLTTAVMIKKYTSLCIKAEYIKKEEEPILLRKLTNIDVVTDNSIPGYARTDYEDGMYYIKINGTKRQEMGEEFFEEIVFRELSYLAFDLRRDINGMGENRFKEFFDKNSDIGADNQLLKYPVWGVVALTDVMAQSLSQVLVEEDREKPIYFIDYKKSDITEPPLEAKSSLRTSWEFERVVNRFAMALYMKKDGLKRLCSDSLKDGAIDTIFERYTSRKAGNRELFKMLGYMGNLSIAFYSKYGIQEVNKTEENKKPRNVHEAMIKTLKWITEVENSTITLKED